MLTLQKRQEDSGTESDTWPWFNGRVSVISVPLQPPACSVQGRVKRRPQDEGKDCVVSEMETFPKLFLFLLPHLLIFSI